MEARGTYGAGARSSKQIWIAVAALVAVIALGVAGAFLARGLGTAGAPNSVKTVTTSVMAPDAAERNAQLQAMHAGPVLLDRNAQPIAARNAKFQQLHAEPELIDPSTPAIAAPSTRETVVGRSGPQGG
ncbi:MAG: hypothetical protein ACREOM_11120 [Candidatus Dormibacteraceae bacterium]